VVTENEVIEAVAAYLEQQHYRIEQKLRTGERGIDLIARAPKVKRRLLVEAKGGTSSMEHTNRFGEGFNTGQINSHLAVALYQTVKMQTKYPGDAVAIALPDTPKQRACVEGIRPALDKLDIAVFFVAADRTVSKCGKLK
jgi:hypothetical protein